MNVNVKFKPNKKNIRKIEQAMTESLPLLIEAIKTEVNTMQVVPKETGALEESAATGAENDRAFLSYNTPYARKLYFNPQFDFRQDKNPNAQGRWLDSFIHGPKHSWLIRSYGELMRQNSQRVIKK